VGINITGEIVGKLLNKDKIIKLNNCTGFLSFGEGWGEVK